MHFSTVLLSVACGLDFAVALANIARLPLQTHRHMASSALLTNRERFGFGGSDFGMMRIELTDSELCDSEC